MRKRKLFDDDYPDYFLAEDDEKKPSAADRGVIDFGAEAAEKDALADDEDARRRGGWLWMWAIAAAIAAAAAIFGYVLYVRPAVDDALMTARVESVEKRGTVFKRFEAEVTDVRTGRRQEVSIDGDDLGRRLQEAQLAGETVRLRYRRYRRALPWRGESATEVYEIDVAMLK